MRPRPPEYTLEFLLDFDGRVHWYPDGYHVRFEIRRVRRTAERPHGLRYSFTLHDPNGRRLVGFDNAHGVTERRARSSASDHWHRTEDDKGRPYAFVDAETLIEDFFDEVARVLKERGIRLEVVEATSEGKP